MAADGTGYLIPDNPQPDELNCLLVFYPDDPMYLAALLGSITYLGTWTAWERDPDKRARLAAAAWKEANECTLDSMSCVTDLVTALTGINQTLVAIQQAIENQSISLDTGDIVTAVNGVQTAIENQQLSLDTGDIVTAVNGVQTAIENLVFDSVMSEEDMSITINNCCNCGCGCSSQTGSADTTIPEDDEPITTPPEDTTPPVNPSAAQKCSMAHFFIYTVRLSLLRAVEHTGGLTAFREYMQSLWANVKYLATDVIVRPISYEAYAWIIQHLNGSPSAVGNVSTLFDQHYDYYCCQLFSSTSETDAYQRLFIAFQETLSAYPEIRSSAQNVAQYLPYELLFANAGDVEIPAGFGGRSCCGQSLDDIIEIPIPDEQSQYFLAQPLLSEITLTPNNGSAQITYDETYGIWTHTPLNGSLSYHEISVNINEAAMCARIGATSLHAGIAYFIEIVNNAANTGLKDFPHTNAGLVAVQTGSFLCRVDNAEYTNQQGFRDYIDQLESHSTYGNGALDGTWRSQTYGTSSQGMGAMRYRVWFVAKKA